MYVSVQECDIHHKGEWCQKGKCTYETIRYLGQLHGIRGNLYLLYTYMKLNVNYMHYLALCNDVCNNRNEKNL